MAIFRMYTDSEGHSHIEEQTITSHASLSDPRSAVQLQFHEVPVDYFSDWHPAPRRQCSIILEGQMELGLRDGTLWQLNPGDAILAEDVTGSGHTTRVSSATPAITAVIPLAD
jgi:quercetin dioxygenase-like cupin family protein